MTAPGTPAPPEGPLRVLAVTNMYPTEQDPVFGTFVATQMDSVREAGATVQVEFIDGRASDWNYPRAAVRIRRLAGGGGFDLVHAHYGLTGFFCALQGLPLVVSYCGDDLLGTPDGRGGLTAKSRLIRRLSRRSAMRADGIICKSEELAAALPARIDRARVAVIPNGVDLRRFTPGDRAEARRRLGLDAEERLVLFPNSPDHRKRKDLAEAAVALLPAGCRARLWVVRGVPPDRMPDHYRAADCLVLTSDWEGSPNVIKEALCTDLPVVSVAAGDAARWIDLAPGARLVARAPKAIAEGLSAVLQGPGRVDGTRVREAVGLPAVAARVLAVYRQAINRRGRDRGRRIRG